jgi:hypothetical protein
MNWVFEARQRFGLCVLDYTVTSNHVHLLVKDTGADVIPDSSSISRSERSIALTGRGGFP